jgi:hypothetical protein
VTAVGLANLADKAYFGHGPASLLMQDSIVSGGKAIGLGVFWNSMISIMQDRAYTVSDSVVAEHIKRLPSSGLRTSDRMEAGYRIYAGATYRPRRTNMILKIIWEYVKNGRRIMKLLRRCLNDGILMTLTNQESALVDRIG